jgi:hypothetical protein
MQGRLVEWDFEGLSDVLEISPESTVMACWINMSASENLTDAARAAIPQSIGLNYPSQLYGTRIEKMARVDFNGTWAEYHWIRPYHMGYNSLVIPYQDYMMIPVEDYVTVLGKPVLFGPQDSVRSVIDVISGALPAEGFTFVSDEQADFSVAALGSGGMSMPLSGGYKEFYLSVKAASNQDQSFDLSARCLQPLASVSSQVEQIAMKNNLSFSNQGTSMEITGAVARENLQSVLTALLGP